MVSLSTVARRYKWPLIGGAAGLAALASFSAARDRAAAAAAAAPPPPAPEGSIDPAAVAGLIGQGSSIAQGAFGLAAAPTVAALDLAGLATAGAQGLAATLANSQAGLGSALGSALGAVAGSLADVVTSPTGLVVTPNPTPPPATPPPPATSSPPPPTSTPPKSTKTTKRETFVGYYVHVRPGRIKGLVGGCGHWAARYLTFAVASNAPVARVACDKRGIAWRTIAGGYSGAHYASWESDGRGLWSITKRYKVDELDQSGRIVKSSTRDATIGQTGS